MSDSFLMNYQQSPRDEFSASLWSEISDQERAGKRNSRPRALRWAVGTAVVLVVVTLIALFVPSVHALAVELLQKIGVLSYTETNTVDLTMIEDAGTGNFITLQEARERFPVAFTLPAWIPEPFYPQPVFSKRQGVDKEVVPYVHAQWSSSRGFINLIISQYDPKTVNRYFTDHAEPVGEGSLQEVTVNGIPAALVVGGWTAVEPPDENGKLTLVWSSDANQATLTWVRDKLLYTLLWSSQPGTDQPITTDEMIQMAESIP